MNIIFFFLDNIEMGNRGSKSVLFNNIAVKEQRVDGSSDTFLGR